MAIDQEERRMFRFGRHTFTIGERVRWKTGKRTQEGIILSEPFNDGQWIEIRTAYKTHPVRRVSIKCNVEPA